MPDLPTHAGGVVYRRRSNEFEFLLVRARDDPTLWVLPKGHIEAGESEQQTAVREVREEAGVVTSVEDSIGADAFDGPRGPVRAVYFLLRYESEAQPDEDRDRIWTEAGDASEKVRFEGARRIVERAVQILRERTP